MRLILITVMLLASTAANAWYHPIIPPVVKTPPVISGGGGGAACAAGCLWAGAFVTVVAMAIVADEVKRGMAGPACATGKMRQSWFGQVKDEPKLWRPKCKNGDPKPIAVRG